MQRPWLTHYPPDVPADIDIRAHASLVELCEVVAERYAEQRAFGNFGSFMTFLQLWQSARDFAAYLQTETGITRGDRVAIMMPNLLQYPVAMLGALRAGATVVNTNPQYTARELRHQLTDAGARVVVVLKNMLPVVAEVRADTAIETVIVTRLGDLMPFPKSVVLNVAGRRRAPAAPPGGDTVSFTTALRTGARRPFAPVTLSHEDLAFLQYTGGTTGVAKGAMLSHGNIIANVLQVAAWYQEMAEAGREIIITALPLYHIYALTVNCFSFMYHGALNYLITDPRNLDRFVRELKRVPFTAITGVNTLFNALLAHRDFASVDFSHLKHTSGGGMAVQRPVAERWQAVTRCVLSEGYGLTEASPVVCINPVTAGGFTGCIGIPVPSTECCIRDDTGRTLGVDEPGELCVRGPQVMQGYWRSPAATAEVITPDGWLKTGDIAVMRADGYFKIVDRKKDMILVSGFNVYPNEIEEVVAAHPGVAEVAAIGIADPKSSEAVRLVVVRGDPRATAENIMEHCRRNLTGYKCPRSIVFADALPKTNVGKVLRRAVRERYGDPATP